MRSSISVAEGPSNKNFPCQPQTFRQCFLVQCRGQSLLPEMPDHPFRIHVADQRIPGHRTTSDTLQRTVEPATTRLQRRVDLGLPVMPRGMKVDPDGTDRQLPDEVIQDGKDVFRCREPHRIGHGQDAYAQLRQCGSPFIYYFFVPRIAVGIPEAHRQIDDQFFLSLCAEVLYLFHRGETAFDGLVRIAQLKSLRYRKRETQEVDRVMRGGLFGAPEIGDDSEQPGTGAAQMKPPEHLSGIRHLGDGARRYEAAEIEHVETHAQERIQVFDLLCGGNDSRPTLHGIARTFDQSDLPLFRSAVPASGWLNLGLAHNRCFMASYKIIPAATDTLNESNWPVIGIVKCSSADFSR